MPVSAEPEGRLQLAGQPALEQGLPVLAEELREPVLAEPEERLQPAEQPASVAAEVEQPVLAGELPPAQVEASEQQEPVLAEPEGRLQAEEQPVSAAGAEQQV